MFEKKCKICDVIFSVTNKNKGKIFCSKACKQTADKRALKKRYDASPELARQRARVQYAKNRKTLSTRSAQRQRVARIKNPEPFKFNKIKQIYGISREEFEALICIQDFRCAICRKEIDPTVNSKKSKALIDHNHKSGKIRGIVCINCNSILGYCKEDPKILLEAIRYLEKFKRSVS